MTIIGLKRLYLGHKIVKRMSSTLYSYEEAVQKLNLLQSNKATIEQIRRDIKTGRKCTNLEEMENYLLRTGVTLTMLDDLSIIHVAGTKGKGSTSAMCESILRAYGFKTGFYSSPHLIAVRERIRLCGRILSEREFSEHFHQVYNALYDTQAFNGDMPKYFSFLTVLAFNVFLKEKVDVAIVEVGIGGIVDYTNVVRKVPVVGITALGLDHTSILGHTLPEIAAAKAGIMKQGCVAYTVQQPPDAMNVLRTVADTVKCSLTVVPEYTSYSYENGLKHYIDLEAYRINASLAIQLAHAWMRVDRKRTRKSSRRQVNGKLLTNGYLEIDPVVTEKCKDGVLVEVLSKETVLGLKECKWPGRYQVVNTDYATFYLDGAHTKESIEICAKWFKDNVRGPSLIRTYADLIYRSKHQWRLLCCMCTTLLNFIADNIDLVPMLVQVSIKNRPSVIVPALVHRLAPIITSLSTFSQESKEKVFTVSGKLKTKAKSRKQKSILLFSATGDRDSEMLLLPLSSIDFETVFFVIPTAHTCLSKRNDNYSVLEQEELISRCQNNARAWKKISKNNCEIKVMKCVFEALESIKERYKNIPVLITGSLHLVGATLSIIDPELRMT